MSKLDECKAALGALGSPEKAKNAARFFKSGPSQYGEGDVFIGVTVPEVRKIAKSYYDLPLSDVEGLLMSPIHEERLVALIILVRQFAAADDAAKEKIYDFYISHTRRINNWDLVDASAEFIVGPWLEDKDRTILVKLAHSDLLWDRRIAMLSTFHYIMKGDPEEALKIAAILVHDEHDLIQKAVGWMLREVGKRCSLQAERTFLDSHHKEMPRTMLRYAIERFPADMKKHYLGR